MSFSGIHSKSVSKKPLEQWEEDDFAVLDVKRIINVVVVGPGDCKLRFLVQ